MKTKTTSYFIFWP